MGERNMTTEQLRAIERWENEGGNVSRALRIMPGSWIGNTRNEQPASQELIVPRKNRGWEKVDVWPRWRFV